MIGSFEVTGNKNNAKDNGATNGVKNIRVPRPGNDPNINIQYIPNLHFLPQIT